MSTLSRSGLSRPWMAPTLSPDRRAQLVLEAMTLDEKIQLVHGPMGATIPGITEGPTEALGGDGFVPGIPRLGIPDLNLIGAGAGVTDLGLRPNGQSVALPSPLCETATWNLDLAYEFGRVIGQETRRQGFNVSLGGGANLTREPRCGRNFEYHGEDPLLAGRMLGRELSAIQDQRIIACIKHYALNAQDSGRFGLNAVIDRRSLRESDLLAFEIAIRESGVGAVMGAYNKVNGDYCCENDYLLNQVLKREWGFPGWIMSDWGATHSTVKAALAGLDQEFFLSQFFSGALKHAVETGEVPEARLDDMVHRILRTMFLFGVIDNPPVVEPIDVSSDSDVALRVAEEGCVLLRNTGLLPLAGERLGSIAVIGSHADKGVLSGGGSAQVNPVGGNALPPPEPPKDIMTRLRQLVWHPSPPLMAIRAKAPNAFVEYDDGGDTTAAAALAARSDVAIVLVHQHTSEFWDVPTLALPANQDNLVRAVAAANPRTVVVAETGGAVLMPWAKDVAAILQAWYPGQRGGEAIARILFGDVNPSGKLPITFPVSDADLPHPELQQPPLGGDMFNVPSFDVHYTEGVKVGYKWYDAEGKEPLYPFGHGLSYTTFAYSGLQIDPACELTVEFNVQNTGPREGAEIAQVYLRFPPQAGEPPKRLVGWRKVHLKSGDAKTVVVTVDRQMFSVFNPDTDAWEVIPGTYGVMVGGSSGDLPLAAEMDVKGR